MEESTLPRELWIEKNNYLRLVKTIYSWEMKISNRLKSRDMIQCMELLDTL